MARVIVFLLTLLLFSCSAVTVGHSRNKVIVESEKPFCDVSKVDPNCKISDDVSK